MTDSKPCAVPSVTCPNCDTDLPIGCGGVFKDSDGDSCWLNRPEKVEGAKSSAAEEVKPLTRLRDCWSCGTAMDYDQSPVKCSACGAANPCGDKPAAAPSVQSAPCEKCGTEVFGYVEQRCCNGHECGCMGLPVEPCWCDDCWREWEQRTQEHAGLLNEANL